MLLLLCSQAAALMSSSSLAGLCRHCCELQVAMSLFTSTQEGAEGWGQEQHEDALFPFIVQLLLLGSVLVSLCYMGFKRRKALRLSEVGCGRTSLLM